MVRNKNSPNLFRLLDVPYFQNDQKFLKTALKKLFFASWISLLKETRCSYQIMLDV